MKEFGCIDVWPRSQSDGSWCQRFLGGQDAEVRKTGKVPNGGKRGGMAGSLSGELRNFPLSRQQESVWVAQQLNPEGDHYNVPVAYALSGAVSEAALAEALRRVLRRHPVLRVSIRQAADGEVRQSVCAVPDDVLRVHEVSRVELDKRIDDEVSAPFTADATCRLRADLFRFAAEEAVLLLVLDHVATDAPSVPLLLRELGEAYDAELDAVPDAGGDPADGYFDYILRQRAEDVSVEGRASAGFWGDLVADLETVATPPRQAHERMSAPASKSSLPVVLGADLAEAAERLRATPFALLLSAFSLTLQHFLRSDDVVISYPAVDWRRSEYDPVVGLFTDLLVFRGPSRSGRSLPAYVTAVQESLFACLEHQGASLEKLWARLRDLTGGGAVVPPMLSVNETGQGLRLRGLETDRLPLAPRTAKSELMLSVDLRPGRSTARLDFDPAVYPPAVAERLARAFETVLGQVADGWDGPATAVDLVGPADRSLVLEGWNAAPGEPTAPHVPAAFLRQAEAAPDRIALIEEGREITYGELESVSRSLAGRLAALDLPPGSVVALCLPRSARFVIAALAVLRCGLALLPVDLEQPARRRSFVLVDSGAAAAVVPDAAAAAGLPDGLTAVVWGAGPPGTETVFEDRVADPEDPAYVITTSGSTGLPKAVVVPHRALANNLHWKRTEFGFRAEDRFYFKTPPVFDASLWEYLAPLTVGAAVVLAPPQAHRDPALMADQMRRYAVTVVQFVPTVLKAVLAEEAWGEGTALRWVFAGGEPLDPWVAEAVRRDSGARVVNLYGPTETAIDVISHTCAPGDAQGSTEPIGRPIPGAQAYVLGPGGQLLPPTFVGELCIGGLPLALGYANRAEQTAERFVPHPFGGAPGARLYRTGDLASFRTDGVLDFHGREDAQVKVRGLRVDLDGIRNLLLEHPDVRDAVVTVRGGMPDALIAYVVPRTGGEPVDVRGHLADRLPTEHLPTGVMYLTEMPVTVTGKVDLRALPRPETGRAATPDGGPRTDLERRLTELWATALGTEPERVPRDRSLFELGGTSLTLIHLHRRLRTEIAAGISVTDLFKYPTVAAVARAVSGSDNDEG
ncbi:amino acid adenylation domain-containing protein [Streptomyces sp. NPDC008092]|uniref:non-ribosomal peptide synthetase n=1 Tax=Streptomyces sp. NPDC008092 TaxID=3364808 RepID=UPI0036E005D7